MSLSKKWIQGFLAELPELKASGVIDEGAEARLRDHYEAQLASRSNSAQWVFQISMAILGGILIGGGIILLFNYNWDMLPKTVRIGVSALPLLMGAGLSLYTLCKEKSAAWQEVSAILTAVGGAVFIALLSQIYQINGSLFNYLTLVLTTAFPLIYIFDSKGLAILYQLALFGLFANYNWSPSIKVLLPQALLGLAVVPWLVWKLRRGTHAVQILSRYLVIAMVIYQTGVWGSQHAVELCECYFILLGCAFNLLAMRMHEQGERGLRNPWHAGSFLVLLVVMTTGSYTYSRNGLIAWEHAEMTSAAMLVVGYYLACIFCLVALTCWLFYDSVKKHTLHAEKVVLGVFLLGGLIEGTLLMGIDGIGLRFFYMLAMVAWGVAMMWRGVMHQRMALFNEGLLLISIFIICRFVDSDLGLLARAAGFILAGVLFLTANLFFSRKCRRAKLVPNQTAKEEDQ